MELRPGSDVHRHTALSLCSGIGGLDHGLANAGWTHVGFCESEPYRRDVLRARFPGVPIHEDLRDFAHADERGRRGSLARAGLRAGLGDSDEPDGERPRWSADLVCGGTPCQDLSVAGRRTGLAGDRSSLFFDFARVISVVRPRWVLWENVPGAFSSNGGRDFGVVLGTLADIGYGLAWRILDSRYFGVPQRRRRVFVVGALADGDPRAAADRAGEVLAVGSRCQGHPATRGETREDVAVASLSGLGTGGPGDNDGQGGRLIANGLVKRYGKGTDSDATDTMIANTLMGNHGKAGGCTVDVEQTYVVAAPLSHGSNARPSDDAWPTLRTEGGGQAVGIGASVRRLTPTECERLQGLPDGWTQLGDTPDSKRYAALGDAVTVPVAEWIGRRMLAA